MLDDLLNAIDQPRQALWNIGSGLAEGDFSKALPGLLGAGAGLGLAATGVGLPLALLGGSALGGLGQGIFGSEAPTREEIGNRFSESIGLDPESVGGLSASILSSTLTDPLSYLPFAGAARAAKTPITGGLTHFTNPAAEAKILEQGVLRGGSNGIFALPSQAASDSHGFRSLVRAGISPKSTQAIPIPEAAIGQFENIAPVGPYSLWKSLGGAKMAPPGEISLGTGAFTPSGSMNLARARFYAPDAIINSGLAATMYGGTRRPRNALIDGLE